VPTGPDGAAGALQRSRARRPAVVAVAFALTVLTAAACTGTTTNGNGASPVAKSGANTTPVPTDSSSSPANDAVITTAPAASANLNPATPITVSIADGTLTSVQLLSPQGKAVRGALASGGTSWQNTEDLGYGRTYKLSATGMSSNGRSVTKTATFSTLTPNNMTMPYLQRQGGYTLDNGATYGVGIIPVVHFDEHITNKKAAQAALSVVSTPAVQGVWYWGDDQNVYYRPQNFWPAGTKVTITAKLYGVRVGSGLYGQQDKAASFTVGRKQVTIAQDNAPQVNKVRVYNSAGTVLRTMNTSMGRHSDETVNGTYINFFTMVGTYTVLEHDNPAMMSSASYGLPANAPGGYAPEPIYWSTKISTDGIYLHELDTTIYQQDHGIDTSHGCLNLNHDNAVWFYNHSLIGDPVVVQHTGGPKITLSQGGAWSVPWSTWLAGSAG
jgi:lipoprotein-anchoring transpeptidase ErfK/SrfK